VGQRAAEIQGGSGHSTGHTGREFRRPLGQEMAGALTLKVQHKLERLELSLWQRNALVIVFRNSQNMHVQILTRAVQTGGLFRGSCATSQQRCAQDRCQDYGDATSRPTGYRVGLLQGVVVWPPFWLPFLVRLRARNRTPTAQHPFQARAYHDRTVAGLLQTSARDMGFDSPRYLSP
jgi:hypothetical protein